MKSVATLDPELAIELREHLRKANIWCESRSITEATGVATTELLVEESQYEAACDAAEAWEKRVSDEAVRESNNVCPKCGSPLERLEHDSLEVVFQCKQCECTIVARA